MRTLLFSFGLILSFISTATAQNITLKGRVLDRETNNPIEATTIYLSRVQDSSVVDYTISDKNGNFALNVKKTDKPTQLKISDVVYENYFKEFESLSASLDVGDIPLAIRSTLIDAIEITFEAPPVRIKNDTLEFNASSFKVRPDANVEALLKQLPGVDISSDGKITVNGKEVNQILVNGKAFFDKDGKIALQNLPAEIINKVQVTDKKTKEQEIAGEAATSDDLSINLTIDEDKNTGYFGRIMGGYGTDDRYESSGLVNYFKGDLKLSVLASSNNINASGFSMDEVFDNMSNINSFNSNSGGGISVNGISLGGMDKGISQSNVIGFNYADKWSEKTDANGSYFYSDSSNENINKTTRVNLLPDNLFTTESQTTSIRDQANHNFNFDTQIKIDSTASLWIAPKFSKSRSKSATLSSEDSFDELGDALNQSLSNNYAESDDLSFSSSIYFFKKLKKKGRSYSVSFRNSNQDADAKSNVNSQTYFFQTTKPDDIRNQSRSVSGKNDKYSLGLTYKEPLTDSLTVKFGLSYENDKSSDTTTTYDFDTATNAYTELNDLLSKSILSKTNSFTPNLGLELRKDKYSANLNFETNLQQYDNSSNYIGNRVALDKNYVTPNINANFRYKFSKSKTLSMRYGYSESLPSASQLLPVENLSNPLHTFIGNPDLETNKMHSANLFLNNYDFASQSGYNAYLYSAYNPSRAIAISSYDQDRKQTTSYTNVSGMYNFSGGGSWYKTYKIDGGHKFSYSLNLNASYNFNKGFTDAKAFEAYIKRVSPTIRFAYEYGELLKLEPTYRLTYNQTDYKNYQTDTTSDVVHRLGIATTSYFPENWVFGNDVGYTYNSRIASGYQKDFLLWNMSLAYNFWDKKLTAKVKVYDLLNQNRSTSRQVSDVAIIDTEDIVLKQYFMFSLSYKIQSFASKQTETPNRRRGGGGRRR
ncbi:MAG TPA: outer membrane beta-barrel protein [Flavobacterium sp.]|nr:outer membrane beta-barrel protein [Flavobacterium sp.]